ncbi:DUF4136 domain-containing protein [Aquimarina agarilytica]|uniref:DUF4136 domain-containing protein n=1 Tax=Aquimarina agarilytica TaxID=1087449 RepID=UPI000287B115|nr:DUF4136 domain-containing protein [Aquimarina agarilytica]
MRQFLYTCLVLIVVSCSGPRVAYDYDTKTDFSKYKTYNYYPDLKTGLSDLDTKRLLDATDTALEAKGFSKSESPQVYVNFKSHKYQTPSRTGVGVGVGNGPISIGGTIPFGRPDQHVQLTVDFIDVQKDELFWQAEADDTQNSEQTPENRVGFFRVMMQKVLSKYPPAKKSK